MLCRNCEKELKEGWKLCPYCKTPIDTEDTEKPEDKKSQENLGASDTEAKTNQGLAVDAVADGIPHFSFVKFLLLTIVTFGIYSIYTFYRFTKAVNALCDGDGKKSPNYVVVLLLGIVTCGIYYQYWMYKQAQRLYEAAPKYNCTVKDSGIRILLWGTFGTFILVGPLIVWHHMFRNVNMLSEQYNGGNVNADYLPVNQGTRNRGVAIGIIAGFYVTIVVLWVLMLSAVAVLLFGTEDYTTLDSADFAAEQSTATPGDLIFGVYMDEEGNSFEIYESQGYTDKGSPCVAEVLVSVAYKYAWSGYITEIDSSPIQVLNSSEEVVALITPEQNGIIVEERSNIGNPRWYDRVSDEKEVAPGLTYNFYEDAENGQLYINDAGQITDMNGNVIDAYSYVTALYSGALYDGDSIMESYSVGDGGKIVIEIPSPVNGQMTTDANINHSRFSTGGDEYQTVTTEEMERNPEMFEGRKIRLDAHFVQLTGKIMVNSPNGYIEIQYDGPAYDTAGNTVGQVIGGDEGYVEGVFTTYDNWLSGTSIRILADRIVLTN